MDLSKKQYIEEIIEDALLSYGMGESISSISKRLDVKYGTVWTWIDQARKEGYFGKE